MEQPVEAESGARFVTELTVVGPERAPAQMLADQVSDGHLGLHDATTASVLNLGGAPIEGPTHLSQIDPFGALLWGQEWFERGCVSAHFRTMVFEGEQVQATLRTDGRGPAVIEAHKADGTEVLTGTVSLGPDHGSTYLDRLRGERPDARDLVILDQLQVGMTIDGGLASVEEAEPNGPAYPFSLAEKLTRITEPHPWYTPAGGKSSPWGRAVLPMEMISVLAMKTGAVWPIRSPVLGLFLDLEIKLVSGPVFVGQPYRLTRTIVGLGETRRTESFWSKIVIADVRSGAEVAVVHLHHGYFKQSYPHYPVDRAPH